MLKSKVQISRNGKQIVYFNVSVFLEDLPISIACNAHFFKAFKLCEDLLQFFLFDMTREITNIETRETFVFSVHGIDSRLLLVRHF